MKLLFFLKKLLFVWDWFLLGRHNFEKCQLFFVVEGIPLDFVKGLRQSTGSSNVDILLWENECVCLLLQRKCMMLDYVCCFACVILFGGESWSVIFFSFYQLVTSNACICCACVIKWAYPYVFVSTPDSYKMGHCRLLLFVWHFGQCACKHLVKR